jgi:hypothetical protein
MFGPPEILFASLDPLLGAIAYGAERWRGDDSLARRGGW